MWRPDGSLRQPQELEDIFAAIKADAARRSPLRRRGVHPRADWGQPTHWAEVREAHFSEGANRRTLAMVESALLYVVLSDAAFEMLDWTSRVSPGARRGRHACAPLPRCRRAST